MGKRLLAVARDLTSLDTLEPGRIVQCFEGRLKVIDNQYRNENGEFLLCEVLNENIEELKDELGHLVYPTNPYEIIGTLHMPGLRYYPNVPGFFIKNIRTGKVMGYSYSEGCQLIFEKGATNAVGILKGGRFPSIQFIQELPPYRSYYWKIQVYDEAGEVYSTLTPAAREAIDRMIERGKELDHHLKKKKR
jgi:hypothetical protein